MTVPPPFPWTGAIVAPALAGDEIHVWRIPLDPPAPEAARLIERLSEDERARAGRFHFDVDRNRFVAAHAALRLLLARYLDAEAYRSPFHLGPNGKPALGPGTSLRFNLAHSRDLGLVALATGREVGVDLEAVDERVEIDDLAQRFFSPEECRGLERVPRARRLEAFFHVWSQKEAYLKARGDGVVFGLDHFDVAPDPGKPAGLLADRREPRARGQWTLLSLHPGLGFRGAVAVEGAEPRVRRFGWE
ncbi:MAG TPA: 4'-phosphopantetheinyl transferase superfamily protein [Gemmatimonadales bacterium]|nr:4'-phosphopantetheinyl transferase superfamily protein [Gemmatimonadales bacterium]